jgi:O-antigen/teichoic acid export membrane protein
MRSVVRQLFENRFLKVAGANGIITIAKSILMIIANKVVATIVGASGIAMVGQLQNLISITTLISSGGFNQGLTKYISEKQHDMKSVSEYIGTAFMISTVLTTIIAVVLILFSNSISFKIFSTTSYSSILIIFAGTLFFYNLNALILAIVNGFQEYRQYFKINITTTIVGFLLTVVLVYELKAYGALLAIVLSQSIVCVLTFLYVRKRYWILALSFKNYSKEKLFFLLKYTTMTLITAITWPVVDMIIRTYVIHNISAKEAGLWQATRNINDYIVFMAVGSFSIYLLPRLSSLTDKVQLKQELISIYKIIIPVTLVGFLTVYLLKDYVILILYSKDFLKVGQYLLLQMIGSFFWMCKVPIMNYMFAKGLSKAFVASEVVFAAIYVVLVIVFIPRYQVQGIQLSFAIYNLMYFITNIFIVRWHLK